MPLNVKNLVDSYIPNHSFPAKFYNDSEVFLHDLDRIFCRHWIYAGHVTQLPEAGSFFLVEFANESIIVNRAKDQQIRAFANVCRHRGSRICLEKSGRTSSFVCPYHAWTYDLDGRLRSKRDMPEDFDRSKFGLKNIAVAEFQGMIFINLDANATDFTEALAPMAESLKIYGLENTRVAHQATFEVAANWKLAVENFLECYHCGPAHAEYSCSHALTSPKDYEALRPEMLKRSAEIGYATTAIDYSNPDTLLAPAYFYARSAMYPPYVTGSESGEPVAPLLGSIPEFGGGAADIMLGPVTYGILYPDHVVLYRFLATELHKTEMEIVWLVRDNAVEGKDYDLDKLIWLWTITTEADKTIIFNNQRGVDSKFYEPGPLSTQESYITGFVDWYLGQIAD